MLFSTTVVEWRSERQRMENTQTKQVEIDNMGVGGGEKNSKEIKERTKRKK